MIVVKGYSHPVRVWLDSTQVLMLDVQYPEISPSLSTVLNKLGEPAAKLDYDWGALRIARGEWVYPERGLALFINPNNFVLLHLAVFSPTTAQTYESKLRLRLGKRPFPGNVQ